MAKYLPIFSYFEDPSQGRLSEKEKTRGKKVQENLGTILTKQRIADLFVLKVDQVYIQLMYRFFDPKHFIEQFNMAQTLPEPDDPWYNYEHTSWAIKYIEVSKISRILKLKKLFYSKKFILFTETVSSRAVNNSILY